MQGASRGSYCWERKMELLNFRMYLCHIYVLVRCGIQSIPEWTGLYRNGLDSATDQSITELESLVRKNFLQRNRAILFNATNATYSSTQYTPQRSMQHTLYIAILPVYCDIPAFTIMSVAEDNSDVDLDQFHLLGSTPSQSAIEAFSGTARIKFEEYLHTTSIAK
ncbi:hypothetical protein EV426DRAFT_216418 [Tirmania nivea]|nr:hypothetical protein EV426DRAFT_216418 [Tirmania nivea]